MIVNPEPISKVSTFTIAAGVIGLAGLYYFGDQTVRWGNDVWKAHDKKKSFLQAKTVAVKNYQIHVANLKEKDEESDFQFNSYNG